MQSTTCDVLYRPDNDALRFLPEGPYTASDGMLSWVAIQHGADATIGSLNLLNTDTRTNESCTLPGRPGFAFPTDRLQVFVVGAERTLGLFDTQSGEWTELTTDVDADVTNTIINDGVIHDGNLIFGCKDLEFATPKAGLYLWRRRDHQLIQLRSDQLCSNGKAVVESAGSLWLYDIDSPTKQVTRSLLDIDAGHLGRAETVVDLSGEEVFPDGMILTPDHNSLIVAIYNPADADYGEARQYGLADAQLQALWTCPGAAQVTCPQLLQRNGKVELILTTAVEHLSPERLAHQPNAGCIFSGQTSFTAVGDQPVFPIGDLM